MGFVGAVLALFLLLFGIYAGVGAGDILSKRCVTRGDYWRWNLIVLGAGALATALVCLTGLFMLVVLVFGVMAGTIAGLKMGFGESVGPWKKVDRAFRVNKDHVRRSEDPEAAEAARRARKEGREVELMSVEEPVARDGDKK
ncbi:hypothetical protein [Paratractidigestivibacter sp.]|uniref:hypothetical protein n=1 Tax=Paratractidigestivibacter sp. TaxID=2847316 RepID=UPI002ABE1176|nr:hypothetical protein [Paratractidigestivibacter sp.]